MAERVLQHEAADAGSGVDDGEDEERFEHDGEVIPEGHDGLSAEGVGKNLRHATANAGAPPVRLKSVCSPTAWASVAICAAVTGNPMN